MERKEVFEVIDIERDVQERKWEDPLPPDPAPQTLEQHALFMKGYVDDLMTTCSNNGSIDEKLSSIREITATGIRAMELFG